VPQPGCQILLKKKKTHLGLSRHLHKRFLKKLLSPPATFPFSVLCIVTVLM
jgi:hypothetical protein